MYWKQPLDLTLYIRRIVGHDIDPLLAFSKLQDFAVNLIQGQSVTTNIFIYSFKHVC